MTVEPKISKSQYIKGLQCPKALWYYRHRKDLAPEIDPATQARFDTGHEIGELAKQYFEGGVEVTNDYRDIKGAIAATEQFVKDGHSVIYEATAMHPVDGSYSRIDILKRVEETDEWDMIEVKSSTSVKDYHLDDMALQYHAFYNAGYKIGCCFMMVIDNSYIRDGDIGPRQLFRLEDISDFVFSKQGEVEQVAGQLGYVLDRKDEPQIKIGSRCFSPFECDYRHHCWKNVPEVSVYDFFSKDKAEEIADKHGYELTKLPEDLRPSGKKSADLESYINNEIIIDATKIRIFLGELAWPLYFLDYETVGAAVPQFDSTKPYQQVTFQFSLHIEPEPGAELIHHEFLHKERSDPRTPFTEKLVELCGEDGSIIAYNKSFEVTCNTKLAEYLPEYGEQLEAINARMVDLLVPFRSRWLYHPSQLSSASIKAVLPAFTDQSYSELNISGGEDASQLYSDFLTGKLPKEEHGALWNNLSEYCKLDTYAMKVLLDVLHEKCGEQ
ncbi:MAG: hypothetical protein DHS20C02_10810 [Micavibrio sp.]|nr:MAG: hypothetical protein DHS20C02_10810 [Micavibrio sp.]